MRIITSPQVLSLLDQLLKSMPDRWSRRRVQSPRTVLATLLILAIERGTTSTRRALSLISGLFPVSGRKRPEPCPAAFCRSRRLLDETTLRSLFHDISSRIQQAKRPAQDLSNGCRFIAIDGSQCSVPRTPDTIKQFGCYEHAKPSHQPQTRLVVAWDVVSRCPVDWMAGTCFASERDIAINMAAKLPKQSVVLLDRGFHGIAGIKAFSDAQIGCFMRIRGGKTTWLAVQKFLKGKPSDAVITITGKIADEPISMRCRVVKATRINTRKGTTETLVFLTNLMDRATWPRSLLLKLYSLRWDIETSFREMKIQDHLEGFHAHTADGIRQEIAAYMIARLLAGTLLAEAANGCDTKDHAWDNKRRLIWNNRTIIDALTDIMLAMFGSATRQSPSEILAHRLAGIAAAAQRRRPGRTYIRKCKGRYGRWKGTKNHRFQKGRNSQVHLTK